MPDRTELESGAPALMLARLRRPNRMADAPADEPSEDGTLVAAARYYDQLIDPDQPFDEAPLAGPAASGTGAGLPGRGSIEYRLFDQTTDFDGSERGYTEQGVSAVAEQETNGFGRFEFRGALTDAHNGDHVGVFEFDGGNHFQLAQRDFALNGRWIMNNELGHVRALSPVEVSSGYRFRLPAPLIEGAVLEASSPDMSLRLTSGSLGSYRGRTFPVFTQDGVSGHLDGIAGAVRFGSGWSAAAQVWQSDDVISRHGDGDFRTWAGGLRYDGQDAGSAQLIVLYNDHGATGLWAEGERRAGAWLHNAGLFRLDRDLEWVDAFSTVQNDVEGAYWRGSTRSFRNTISTGIDWSRTNIDGDPAVPRRSNAAAFAAWSHRLSVDTSVTGSVTLGRDEFHNGVAWESRRWSARGALSRRWGEGRSVWALAASERSGPFGSSRYDASWDHDWSPYAGLALLRTGVAFVDQSGSTNDFSQATVRTSATWSGDRWRVSGGLSAGYYDTDYAEEGSTFAAVLSLGAEVGYGWQMSADLGYNRNALTLLADGEETRVSDRQFLLSLRRDLRWGAPRAPVGRANGAYGYGSVRGVLFLDHNDNGVRDPEEAGAGNVIVYLDGAYSTETDAAGEFDFAPVATGEHHLSIDIANVPLPWAVSDRPVRVQVAPRRAAIVEIPLHKDLL